LPKSAKWISVKDRLPEKDGRYLVLQTFVEPLISNYSIVRKNVPFVSNFTMEKGWMIAIDLAEIRYWMNIPEPPKG
jgi:hypothetical protein